MDWTVILGVISSIVSIFGAFWSLFNVNIIKKTKQEIFSRLKVVKYSNINVNTKNTILQVRKIALKNKIPKGLNLNEINDSLKDYYERIHEISNDIEKEGSDKIITQINEFKINISSVSKLSKDFESELIDGYNQIYYQILEIDKEIDKFKQNIIEK